MPTCVCAWRVCVGIRDPCPASIRGHGSRIPHARMRFGSTSAMYVYTYMYAIGSTF